MPWIKEEKLYPILVLLLIFIMAVRMPMDSDMWWHLRAGQETIRSGHVYRVDTFSSTRAGEDWINHSWLSQVIMALILRIASFPGLSIWVAICAVLSMGMVYIQMKGPALLRCAVLILAAVVASVVWSPRPQIMSLVLLALLSWLVHQYRNTKRWPYLAVSSSLFVLWANFHGGYVLGLIYLGAVIGGDLLERMLFREDPDGLEWKELGFIGAALILGFILVLINPFGIELWKIPFNTVGVETLQNLINEWASPDFHQAFQQPFLWMMLGLLGLLGLTGKAMRGYRLVPVVIFAWAALVARRNFGPFAIISAPALAEQLSYVWLDWKERARHRVPEFDRMVRSAEKNKVDFNVFARNILNASLIFLLLFAGIVKSIKVNDPGLVESTENDLFPVGAVKWITEQDVPVALFNDYNWGGYLIYHLQEEPVFVDGRTDLFGDEILDDYLAVIRVDEGWEMILKDYDLDTLLLRSDSNLSKAADLQGWKIVYSDDLAVILTKEH